MEKKKTEEQTDMIAGILNLNVGNVDLISEADRLYCQHQQMLLYQSLDKIDQWYEIFRKEMENFRGELDFTYRRDGSINVNTFRSRLDDRENYTSCEFNPIDSIKLLAGNNHDANIRFASRIIEHFNRTYHISVPVPEIDRDDTPMGYRPSFQTYVDWVIEYLGGKGFREKAEDELVKKLHGLVKPASWSRRRAELKKDCIVFANILSYDDICIEYHGKYNISYSYDINLDLLCRGVAYGADDYLGGGSCIIIGFDEDDVKMASWYDLTTTNATKIRFYKNGRIDVKFKDVASAEYCFNRLHLQ